MSRRCSICACEAAGTINGLLQDGRSIRSVATEFAVSEDALGRHASRHLTRSEAPIATADNGADPLDELVQTLRARALAGDPAVVREYRLALAAQQATRHATAPQQAISSSREWIELRTAILRALEPFPEARLAVGEALA
jgi:hypothetical protein